MPSLEDPMSRSPSSGMTMAPGALPHSSSGGVSPPSRSSSRTMDSPAERSRSHLEDQPHASPYVTQSNPFTSTGSLMRIANRYSPYHDYQAPRSLRGQGRRSTRDLLLSPPDRSFNSLSESCGPPSLEYLSPSSWPHNQELSSDAGHPYAAYSYEDSNTADWDYSPAVGGDALAYPPYSPISPPRILNHGMVPSCFPEEQFGSTDGFLPTSVYDCNIIGPGPSHLG
ncbi:hypothetical protein AX16_004739 [Volvariella volvacea WC 439]|nr:hypothetical protein AX16_004739 [Volvariella volvacea WC 439]